MYRNEPRQVEFRAGRTSRRRCIQGLVFPGLVLTCALVAISAAPANPAARQGGGPITYDPSDSITITGDMLYEELAQAMTACVVAPPLNECDEGVEIDVDVSLSTGGGFAQFQEIGLSCNVPDDSDSCTLAEADGSVTANFSLNAENTGISSNHIWSLNGSSYSEVTCERGCGGFGQTNCALASILGDLPEVESRVEFTVTETTQFEIIGNLWGQGGQEFDKDATGTWTITGSGGVVETGSLDLGDLQHVDVITLTADTYVLTTTLEAYAYGEADSECTGSGRDRASGSGAFGLEYDFVLLEVDS